MPYVIAKTSRAPTREGYSGPSCARAGVMPGRVYEDRIEAEDDADKLSAVNPVGFAVHEQPDA